MQQVDPADRLLVTNHEAFGYFVDAYGLTYVGAIIPSFDDNAEVSAADIDDLVDAVRDSGATAVFSETTLSPAAAETIASEAGVEVSAATTDSTATLSGLPAPPAKPTSARWCTTSPFCRGVGRERSRAPAALTE